MSEKRLRDDDIVETEALFRLLDETQKHKKGWIPSTLMDAALELRHQAPDNVVSNWELKFVEVYPEYATPIVNKLRGRREVNKKQLCPEE